MAGIPFNKELTFKYGVVDQVSPLIRRVICNNPGPFTLHGTGTYIVGQGKVCVIDPGPLNDDHVAALMQAVEGEEVTHIVCTHTHMDHSPAAAPLKTATGAPTYGFGPHGSGRPEFSGEESQEGADNDFLPDHEIRDGDKIEGDGWTLQAVYTPGHTSNHTCFTLLEENVLFSGDHIMGWSTTIVSPPDGDMGRYMASLDKLIAMDHVRYWPTHGDTIPDPQNYVRAYKEHRLDRDRQILEQLSKGSQKIPAMVKVMYADVPDYLHPAAARSVLSHLIQLVETGQARCDSEPGPDGVYSKV